MLLISDYLPQLVSLAEWEAIQEECALAADSQNNSDIKELEAKTLRQFCGLSERTISAFYLAGNALYQGRQYLDAADVFFVCAALEPTIADFWHALGLSYLQSDDFDSAGEAFLQVHILLPDDPLCLIYYARSRLGAGAYLAAKETFTMIDKLLQDHPQSSEWDEYLADLRRRLLAAPTAII